MSAPMVTTAVLGPEHRDRIWMDDQGWKFRWDGDGFWSIYRPDWTLADDRIEAALGDCGPFMCIAARDATTATKAGCPCRICGRELPPEHPLSDLIGWPPMLLPGDVPSADEICAPCQEKLGAAAVSGEAKAGK